MLGPRIAALRHRLKMSQSELARQLGISASAVGMYEQGRREPSLDILVTMAEIFGVTTDYLLTGAVHPGREAQLVSQALEQSILTMDQRLDHRGRPFSRQELAVLMAAMLIEP